MSIIISVLLPPCFHSSVFLSFIIFSFFLSIVLNPFSFSSYPLYSFFLFFPSISSFPFPSLPSSFHPFSFRALFPSPTVSLTILYRPSSRYFNAHTTNSKLYLPALRVRLDPVIAKFEWLNSMSASDCMAIVSRL